jgi:hypothetical protein
MIEKLVECPRCGSNACSEMSDEIIQIWLCMGCGFTTNTFMTEENITKVEEVMPNLYKDLKFVDNKQLVWYPNSVTLDDKSMVFADGTGVDEWKWAAVKSIEITEEEKEKFPNSTHRADMSTIKHFEEKDFMDALEYVGYFKTQ